MMGARAMENSVNTIMQLSSSFVVPRCLHVVAELGVADALGDIPLSVEDLATQVGANADALNRALRLLCTHGVFELRHDGYAHTPASRLLRSDHPQSMRSYVRFIGSDFDWNTLGLLEHSIRSGKPAVNLIAPGGAWEYFTQHPQLSEIFDQAMTGRAFGVIAGILANYDFSPYTTIGDIGGGMGHLLKAVLAVTPQAKGILFDQPHVVEHVADTSGGRIEVRGGDFFRTALPACDAYLIMQVIHDWNDADAIAILSAVRRSSPPHAKLLLVEGILPEGSGPSWMKMLDIFMLALLNGRERTRKEFETLMKASGFHLDKVIPIGSEVAILEASVV